MTPTSVRQSYPGHCYRFRVPLTGPTLPTTMKNHCMWLSATPHEQCRCPNHNPIPDQFSREKRPSKPANIPEPYTPSSIPRVLRAPPSGPPVSLRQLPMHLTPHSPSFPLFRGPRCFPVDRHSGSPPDRHLLPASLQPPCSCRQLLPEAEAHVALVDGHTQPLHQLLLALVLGQVQLVEARVRRRQPRSCGLTV